MISLLLGSFGLLFSKKIMILLNTPADVLDMAVLYLNIYFLGLPFLFMYNILSQMFNALGKSRIPLYFLIFSSVFNVWLDYVLVTSFDMGVAGVAWATLIAQGISAVMSFIVFIREMKKFESGQTKVFDKSEMLDMTRVALPSILQQSTVSIGMMLVQSVVNSFGSQALAGFSAAMRIEAICVVPMNGIGAAISSFTAQNIGAEKKERVVKGYRSANWMVLMFAAVICVILELFNTQIISAFLGSDQTATALSTGTSYLAFMGWLFVLLGLKMAVGGLLRGAGDMKMFTIGNLVNLFIRVTLSMIFAPKIGISMIWMAVPIGWLVNGIISYAEYRTGKWKNIHTAKA